MAFADTGGYELDALGAELCANLRGVSARMEDLYWSGSYWKESFFRANYDYEDYAPAFCVGYSGCAQYGGRFEDSEASLCANFQRIKGDSRLTWEDARAAVRAGWERVEDADEAAVGRAGERTVEALGSSLRP